MIKNLAMHSFVAIVHDMLIVFRWADQIQSSIEKLPAVLWLCFSGGLFRQSPLGIVPVTRA